MGTNKIHPKVIQFHKETILHLCTWHHVPKAVSHTILMARATNCSIPNFSMGKQQGLINFKKLGKQHLHFQSQ